MNDTVIVFDRVREYSHQMKGASKGEVINRAINDTLSRTIMTSLTVFLTLLHDGREQYLCPKQVEPLLQQHIVSAHDSLGWR